MASNRDWFLLDPVAVARYGLEDWPQWRGPMPVDGGFVVDCRRRSDGRVERFFLPDALLDDLSVDPLRLCALRLRALDARPGPVG